MNRSIANSTANRITFRQMETVNKTIINHNDNEIDDDNCNDEDTIVTVWEIKFSH